MISADNLENSDVMNRNAMEALFLEVLQCYFILINLHVIKRSHVINMQCSAN